MRRPILAALVLGVLFGPFVSNLPAQITAEQVRRAIDKGVAYLKSQQRNDGSWADYTIFPAGVTSLCTLALLNAGVEPDDQDVKRALGYLRAKRLETTYAISLQTMVLCRSGTKLDLVKIGQNVKWLEGHQVTTGPNKGAWAYGGRISGDGDESNAQFALLALHEAERAGAQVSGQTWARARIYWESGQKPDGSWGYRKGSSTGSMTSAGIASLIIIYDKVRGSDAEVANDRIRCCTGSAEKNERIDRGLRWLAHRDHFSVTRNPGDDEWLLYYLYGLERVGRLTARRFVGQHDWYREGSEHLVRIQDSLSGFFNGTGRVEENPLIGTSLALLFLSKGRRPILIAKLKHPPGDDWNGHRSDVANLTRFVESRWGFDMTWQVVDLQAATTEDLLQSPVLFLCGGEDLLPKTADRQDELARKLRDYLDRGGFLFAVAYRNEAGFDSGFRQLMKRVFREPEYRLHPLDLNHPIWHAEIRLAPQQWRELWGIEFGCRTSVVYSPVYTPKNSRSGPLPSLSCLWELSRTGRGQRFSPEVQTQVDGALAIGVNVLAYATNRELEGKEKHFEMAADRHRDPVERGRMVAAKLRHPGGCNAAPRALLNLMDAAGQKLNIRTAARPTLLGVTDEALFDYHLVFMHGRNDFRLTDVERKQLKTYVDRGGMLFADAICSSEEFTKSFRRAMEATFGGKLEPIAVDDPMLSAKYGGADLKLVERRDPQSDAGGTMQTVARKVPPELEGLKVDGRWAVIFSPFDISCALEKHNSPECRGYTREDATRIALNVVLYSLQE